MAKTILIVEDNALTMQLVNDLLQANGYDTIECPDAREALERIRELRPDLILMDIGLPDVSGLDIVRRLKADEALKTIPIIAVTAYAMNGDEETFRQGGCDGYVAKPFSTRVLLQTVGRFLDRGTGAI